MRKRPRSEAEIQKIAARLGTRWVHGDPVAPFLRRSVNLIDKLVHDDLVAIRDIGAALEVAGIVYQTGNGWTDKLLRGELTKARRWLKERQIQAKGSGRKVNSPTRTAKASGFDAKKKHKNSRFSNATPRRKRQSRRKR
jgi:hypothetical protein